MAPPTGGPLRLPQTPPLNGTLLANAPQDANFQRQVSDARLAAVSALRSMKMNRFPPVWTQYLDDMGLQDRLGERAAERIEDTFSANQVTIASAAAEVGVLRNELESVFTALVAVTDGMKQLSIPTEDLQPGEVEIGFLIPRLAVREELGALGREYQDLKRLIGPFQEIATGSREEIRVKSTSSSDFGLWLEVGVETARLFGSAVAYLIDSYKAVLEIRKLKAEMERLGSPPEAVAIIESQATATMKEAIGTMTDRLLEGYESLPSGDGRVHEVRGNLELSLTEVGRRIDLAYSIQVRSLAPVSEDVGDEEEVEEDPQLVLAHQAIADLQPLLEYRQLEGSPVLSLPMPEEPDGGGEGR